MPQLLAEMAVLDVDKAIYLSYNEESTTVFEIKFDRILWEEITEESEKIYGISKPKRPIKLSKFAATMKEKCKTFTETNVTFLGEFPSLKSNIDFSKQQSGSTMSKSLPHVNGTYNTRHNHTSVKELLQFLAKCKTCFQASHHIERRKASEVLVWLIQDTDRNWNPEVPHALPCAYALKGYSLTVQQMRGMCDDVLTACRSHGINVVGMAFDGQWIKLINRNSQNEPLTLLQLQKDVFGKACKVTKGKQIQYLKEVSKPNIQKVFVADLRGENIMLKKILCMDPNVFHVVKSINWKRLTCFAQMTKSKVLSKANKGKNKQADVDISPETHNLSQTVTQHDCEISQLENPNQPEIHDGIALGHIDITDEHIEKMHDKLVRHSQYWMDKDIGFLKSAISCRNKLNLLKVKDLDIIIEQLQVLYVSRNIKTLKSWKKQEKITSILQILNHESKVIEDKQKSISKKAPKFKVKKLVDMCHKVYAAYPKAFTNSVHAALIYPAQKREWESKNPLAISPQSIDFNWFSYPEIHHKTGYILAKVIDGDHLLVNCRIKVCKDGFETVSKKGWHAVAELNPNIITKSLVEDLLDKQRNSYAQKTFSKEVEDAQNQMGFLECAKFSKLIRNWYEAEDKRGLTSLQRAQYRLAFREWLMHDVKLHSFPPYGSHIKGMPQTMFEGFVSSIDTHLQVLLFQNYLIFE